MIKVNVIWGPPASGKTTYVNDRKGDNDLIFDFDILMRDLSGLDIYDRNKALISYLVDFRAEIVNRLESEESLDAAWLIISFPEGELKEQLENMGAEFVLMDADKQTCLNRIEADDQRKDKAEWKRVVEEWFEKYEAEYGEAENKAALEVKNLVAGNKVTGKKFWNFIKNQADDSQVELRIDGEIVEDDYAWLYEWLEIPYSSPNKFREELKEFKGKGITAWIDSWGGDVFAGVGIYNALKEHNGKVIVKVDGKAVSAGSIIAMAGEEIWMSPGSIMMTHNPWSYAIGEAKDMLHMAEVLDEVKEAIINIYEKKTGRPREELSALMDEETWMSAKKAVAEGFADGILYAEETDPEPVKNFMVSRLAIQNSARNVMQRLLEIRQQNLSGEPPPGEPPGKPPAEPPGDPPPEPPAQQTSDPPEPPAAQQATQQAKSNNGLLSYTLRVQNNLNRRL